MGTVQGYVPGGSRVSKPNRWAFKVLCAAALLGAMPAISPAAAADPATGAADSCARLAAQSLAGLADAPTQIMAAGVVAEASGLPGYCRVQGYVAPSVGFEIRLPVGGWNGKFLQVGCGGWCGTIFGQFFARACDTGLRRGYACLANDQGHKSTEGDVKWAYNNPQAEIDYGYRASHVASLAGKAVIAAYYGRPPQRAYFMGCSGGGREALVAAQRFPADFDGIVAGAPALNVTGGVMRLLWATRVALRADGSALLGRAEADLVHRAAIAQCDTEDGLQDGIIGDPLRCRFDPAKLRCRKRETAGCLSPEQVDAVRRIYAGPTDSAGRALYTGGDVPGAEAEWSFDPKVWADLFRYMAFVPDPGPAWKPADFDFDRDPQRLGMMESILGAANPDLRAFRARGGKLIAWNGWADHAQSGRNVIDYVETVERTMGGRAATQEFLRLFMLPGVEHCGRGPGADSVDWLAYLEAWVERGEAPDRIVAARLKPGHDAGRFPQDPAAIEFSRPAYTHPAITRYKGTGDPAMAGSFGPAPPR